MPLSGGGPQRHHHSLSPTAVPQLRHSCYSLLVSEAKRSTRSHQTAQTMSPPPPVAIFGPLPFWPEPAPSLGAPSVRSAPCTRGTPHMDIGSEIMEDDDIPSVTRARPPAMAAPAAPRLHNRDADAAPRNSSAMPTPRPRGSITAHARWANGFAAATGANASERGLLGLPRLLPQPPAPPAEGGNDRLIVIIIIIIIIIVIIV